MADAAAAITAARGKAFVQVLSCVLSRLVATNDANASTSNAPVTKFHALRPPTISIRDYLERINKYASCSPECFVLALVYIDRLIQRSQLALTSLNVHRVIITAVMMAGKFFDDQYFNNAYYAKVGGVPCPEVNSLELEFLFSINFSLHVTTDLFEKYYGELASHMGVGMPLDLAASAPCDCARLASGLGFSFEEVRYTGMRSPDALAAESAAAGAAAAAGVSSSSASAGAPAAAGGGMAVEGGGGMGGSRAGAEMAVEHPHAGGFRRGEHGECGSACGHGSEEEASVSSSTRRGRGGRAETQEEAVEEGQESSRGRRSGQEEGKSQVSSTSSGLASGLRSAQGLPVVEMASGGSRGGGGWRSGGGPESSSSSSSSSSGR